MDRCAGQGHRRIFIASGTHILMPLMPLYIRDDGVRDLAQKLAERRRSNVTEAVRSALSEALEREADDLAMRRKRIAAILARFDARPELRPGFTDKDLYDEDGNPVL